MKVFKGASGEMKSPFSFGLTDPRNKPGSRYSVTASQLPFFGTQVVVVSVVNTGGDGHYFVNLDGPVCVGLSPCPKYPRRIGLPSGEEELARRIVYRSNVPAPKCPRK